MNDIRFALRQLLKSPWFTTVAVVTLALGLGANLAIVALVNGLFFRPLPGLWQPQHLAIIGTTIKESGFGDTSLPDFHDLQNRNTIFSELSAFAEASFSVSADNSTERLLGEMVSGNYFRTLGTRMAAGRDFLPEEGQEAGRNPVVIISERLWRRRWNGDAGAVGKTIQINGSAFTIVGVAGENFRGCQLPNAHELWVPLQMCSQLQPSTVDRWNDRGDTWVRLVGRLKPGVRLREAGSNLAVLGHQLEAEFPREAKDRSYRVRAYSPFPAVGKTAPIIFMGVLLGVTVIIVTVVCANVAGLFLARLMSRRREVAVRLALGASRFRLVRQSLAEALVVSALGLLLGSLLATRGAHLILGQIPGSGGGPVALDLSLDPNIAWFSLALVILSTLVVGLLPALQSARTQVLSLLKSGERSLTARHSRLRVALVTLQVALCLPLLGGAGLLFRSVKLLSVVDLGMPVDNLLLVDLDPSLNGYDLTRALRFYQQLSERVTGLPGVQAASLAALPPLSNRGVGPGAAYGGGVAEGQPLISGANFVSPDYFRTTGIKLVAGREFLRTDLKDTEPVAIINQSLANKLWPNQPAVGQLLHLVNSDETPKLVVGVVQDAIYSDLREEARRVKPFYYLPLSQRTVIPQTLQVRAVMDPTVLLPGVRNAVRELDPRLPLFHVTTLKEARGRAMFAENVAAELVGFSGVLSIFLAMLGLYAAMGQEVISRTREIGIRLAVGGQRTEIVLMIVRQGMKLALLGIGVGISAAFVLTRALRSLLFGVSPSDPVTYALLLLFAVAVALLACWLPARRAANVDPIVALRYE